jgi:hypothetical protein
MLKKKEKKEKKKSVTAMIPVCTVTGEMKWRLRCTRTPLKEWETLQKDEIGVLAAREGRVPPSAGQSPVRVEAVPPSAGQGQEIRKVRCAR